MEDTTQTLVILLSMHRSGSSLTASILREQGMSLGPWELLGANEGNPHGHFEAVPILELSEAVQTLVHGFASDMPDTPESVAKFLGTQGDWDASTVALQEYVDRGRALIQTLLDSGRISGFKDPRTVLLWPFWQRVLASFPGVRVVPIAVVRSPHEIAMSLFSRRAGECEYWTALDMVAVHFRRLQMILDHWSGPVSRVQFGSPVFLCQLGEAARTCGLEWDRAKALRLFDTSCVHQAPAAVNHSAQDLYRSLCSGRTLTLSPEDNSARLEADARARDQLQFRWLRHAHQVLTESATWSKQTLERLTQTEDQLRHALERLDQVQKELSRSQREGREVWTAYQDVRQRIEKIERHPVVGLILKVRREIRHAIYVLKTRLLTG